MADEPEVINPDDLDAPEAPVEAPAPVEVEAPPPPDPLPPLAPKAPVEHPINIRNLRWARDSMSIDMEVERPEGHWDPTTAQDDDPVTYKLYAAAISGAYGEIEPYVRPERTRDEFNGIVIAERERRLSLGFDYDFGDARGVHRIGTGENDMKGWDEVQKVASAAVLAGMPDLEIGVTTDTGPTKVTALEFQRILLAAGAFRQPIWQASFVLQAADPMPDNPTLDQYWPR